MARDTLENWIADEKASSVLQAPSKGSAVDLVGRREEMATDTKQVPRSGGFTPGVVAKGVAYSESTSTNDYVEVIARKIGGVERIAAEDLRDSTADVLAAKRQDAALAIGKMYDNAALGTSAAANGTTVPFTSVYKAVTTVDAAVGYTANANHTSSSAAGAITYAQLLGTFAKVGASDWGDELVVIAHPSFKFDIMGLSSTSGGPLLQNVLEGGYGGQQLLGVPVVWSMGAIVTATALPGAAVAAGVKGSAGNPILIVANRNLLINGVASLPGVPDGAPGYALQLPQTGAGFLTDEALLKAVVRRGFAVGNVNGAAVLEKIA